VIALAHSPALVLALLGAAPEGMTAPEAPPHNGGLVVEAAGECPGRDRVLAALRPVLGDEVMRSTSGVSRVSDLGDRFEVTALGQTRQYADVARDCDERARVAAVFITLTINPPMFAMPKPPPPPPPRIVAPPQPPPSPAPVVPRWASVGVGARFDGGSPLGSMEIATGAELRGVWGRGSIGAVATVGVLAPTETKLTSVVVHEQRFPCSVGVIGRRALSRFEGAISAGLALVPFTLHGDGLAMPQGGTRLDAGARLALELRLLSSAWLSPFADVHAEYFPRPYDVGVDPVGDIGSTGRLWVGAAVGLAVDVGR
jgi:hypothetical protein